MSKQSVCMDSELKIVLCQEDAEDESHLDTESSAKKSSLKSRIQPQFRNPVSARKHYGSHSAGGLTSNPYQKKMMTCSNCANNNKNNVSSFTQRIMSAKLLRFKQMQNQISEMSLKLNELVEENKTLKTLQRRQDNALKKYEGSKEQLPQLMKSHSEEVRIINIKFKQLKAVNRELEQKLKQRDSELMNLKEQHSHLLQLSRDKHLCERDKLTKKLAALELHSKEQSDKIITLQRKLELQEKNFKHQLQCEIQKHRQAYNKPQTARQVNASFCGTNEGKENGASPRKVFESRSYASQSSLSVPSRKVTIDAVRVSKGESDSMSAPGIKPDEGDEDGDEDDASIRVHGVRGGTVLNLSPRGPMKPPSLQITARSLKADTSGFRKSDFDVSGRVSLSGEEAAVQSAVSEFHFDNSSCSSGSPRLSSRSGGLSIPSDLHVGNLLKAKERRVPSPSISDESDVSSDNRPGLANSSGSSGKPNTHEQPNSTREQAEEDIDQIINKACNNILSHEDDAIINEFETFSLSQELNRIKNLSWNELSKANRPALDELHKKVEFSQQDYSLERDEKNHLLKALNIIDQENKTEGFTDNASDSLQLPQENGRHQSVRQMFAQNRKKADLMKSIFGTDECVAVSEGFH